MPRWLLLLAVLLSVAAPTLAVTDTFPITTSAHDSSASSNLSGTYPPISFDQCHDTDIVNEAIKHNDVGNFVSGVGLFRWDTSSIPNDAIITSALVRLYVNTTFDDDNRSFLLEWMSDWGTCDSSEYTTTTAADAHAGTDITSITGEASNDFALINLSNISLTGITAIRAHISGGEPTGYNQVQWASYDHVSLAAPELLVTYDLPTPTDTPVPPTPTETPVNTNTPTITDTPTITNTPTITDTPSETPTVTQTPTETPAEIVQYVDNTPTNTPTITDMPTNTPTHTQTPTITQTFTNTPTITQTPTPVPETPTLQPFIIFVPNTEVPTPSRTPTGTVTPVQIAQEEEFTSPTCKQLTLTGRIYEVNGNSANTRRVTIAVPYEQVVNGCLIRVSQRTVTTSSTGFLPAGATAFANSVIQLTLEGGVPLEITLPDVTLPLEAVALSPLVGAAMHHNPSDGVTAITVDDDSAHFTLTASQVGTVVTLLRGDVHDFALTTTSYAAGQTILGLADGASDGDMMPHGQPAGGDLTGEWPSPRLAAPFREGQIEWAPGLVTAGTCVSQALYVEGASSGDAVAVTPEAFFPQLMWYGLTVPATTSTGFVGIRLCALVDFTPPSMIYHVRVF